MTALTPERWQKIKAILDDVLETPPQQRSALLAKVCSEDAALREEVESLLALGDEGARTQFLQSPANHVTLPPGTKLGEYEIQSLLGAGGMGEVYRARDPRLRRDVAVKVLPRSLSNDPGRLRRFEQEAQAAAALNHPNILAVYRMGTYEGAPYLVSELLEGETLGEQLTRGPLAVGKAIECALQIARGLTAAHEKGIAHRDLKPGNLFITKDGDAKILDFGLAKLMRQRSAPQHSALTVGEETELGVVLGTASYMSPEQARGGIVDQRSDVFSFGVVLYEMLDGRQPFRAKTSIETLHAIIYDPTPAMRVGSSVAGDLSRIVNKCLAKEPENRYQDMRDVVADLSGAGRRLEATTSGYMTEAFARGRNIRMTAAAVGIVAVLAAGIGAWTALHRSRAESERKTAVADIERLVDIGKFVDV